MMTPSTTCIKKTYSFKTEPFFRLSLPVVPPSVNELYQIVRDGQGRPRLALTRKGRQFKKDASLLLSQANTDWDALLTIRKAVEAAKHCSNAKKRMPCLALSLQFFFKSSKRDIDNGIKILQDVLFDYLEMDDVRAAVLYVEKHVDRAKPRVEIAVSLVEEAA